MANNHLPATLDWSMSSFNGRIEWSDCASVDPSEWSYEDLEIFYMTGRCHHLAMALHRNMGLRICVLFETDPDVLDAAAFSLPHHVFALDGLGQAWDIRGIRTLGEIESDITGTFGLCKPQFLIYRSEQRFVSEVLNRGDGCLLPATEQDIAAAARLIPGRMKTIGDEYREVRDAWRNRKQQAPERIPG